MIVVDTSVLSLAFRRRRAAHPEPSPVRVFRRLIEADVPLVVPGVVLQELLSGVRAEAHFDRLERLLESFPIVVADRSHHVSAARIANACRGHGLTASTVDCLIAAMTIARNARLFTVDADFSKMARHCDLQLLASTRMRATTSSGAAGPAMRRTGSPGTTCVMANARTETPSRTGTVASSLRTAYRPIAAGPPAAYLPTSTRDRSAARAGRRRGRPSRSGPCAATCARRRPGARPGSSPRRRPAPGPGPRPRAR